MKPISEIAEALNEPIPKEVILPPDSNAGVFGDYITAQYAMQKANEIFGPDGIQDFDILSENERYVTLPNGSNAFTLTTTVKVTFRAEHDGGVISFSRIGRGFGIAFPNRDGIIKPQQYDTACKGALSDAIKNALMRVGRALGAELYFDERQAMALGYAEFFGGGDSQTRQRQRPQQQEPVSMLGDKVCNGWGKEKKFQGMTLSEIYDDPDGRSAMAWAAGLDDPKGFTALMAQYYKQRVQQQPQSKTDQQGDDQVMMWFGEMKPKNGIVNWSSLKNNPGFVDMLSQTFNPDGSIKNFGPEHPRFKNHLKRHFHIDSGHGLTWDMLQSLYVYCKSGAEAAAFGWPQYYGGDRAPTTPPSQTKKDDSPSISIGQGSQRQTVPAVLQKAASEAGIENPDEWLWKVIGEKPVGEWTQAYTSLVMKIIETVKDGKADTDTAALMFTVGLDNIGK